MADITPVITSNDSILTSIKKLVTGAGEENTFFDPDMIMYINSVLTILTQLGVGPTTGFFITDSSTKWSEFVEESKVGIVATFVYMKVRLVFDPPTSSALIESLNKVASEYEWRICNG